MRLWLTFMAILGMRYKCALLTSRRSKEEFAGEGVGGGTVAF
jgi:hypothetical protein